MYMLSTIYVYIAYSISDLAVVQTAQLLKVTVHTAYSLSNHS